MLTFIFKLGALGLEKVPDGFILEPFLPSSPIPYSAGKFMEKPSKDDFELERERECKMVRFWIWEAVEVVEKGSVLIAGVEPEVEVEVRFLLMEALWV